MLQEYEKVGIIKKGVIGTIVDIYTGRDRRTIFIIEDDAKNEDGGFDLIDCFDNEIELA